MNIKIEKVIRYNDKILAAINYLLPQLSTNSKSIDSKVLKQIIESNCSHLLIAIDNLVICGSLTLITFQIPTGKRAFIEDVVVDKNYRQNGIATSLIEEAKLIAQKFGAKTVDLTSRPERFAANQLYQKTKFELRNTNVFRYKPN